MKKSFLALALVAASFAASASDSNNIGYTHVQLDAVYADTDAGVYPWGAKLSGSYAFTDNVFATASLGRVEDNDAYGSDNEEYTNKTWSLGIGFNKAIGANADWVSQLAYVHSSHRNEWNYDGFGGSHRARLRGYNVSTGVLGHVTDKLTANAYLGREDYSCHDNDEEDGCSYDGNYYADFGMGYAFNPTWSLQAGLKLNENVETYSVGVRASF